MNNHRLLIVSCSAKKDQSEGWLPAIERYRTGAYAQILYGIPTTWRPDVVFLSARFGYINAFRPLPNYNYKMDKEAARILREDPEQWATLATLVKPWHTDVFIAAGEMYREVINYHLSLNLFNPEAGFTYSQGGIGQQRQQLKQWLLEKKEAA